MLPNVDTTLTGVRAAVIIGLVAALLAGLNYLLLSQGWLQSTLSFEVAKQWCEYYTSDIGLECVNAIRMRCLLVWKLYSSCFIVLRFTCRKAIAFSHSNRGPLPNACLQYVPLSP